MDQTDRSHASFAFRRHHQPRPAKARPMRTMAMAGAAAIATMHDSAAHSRMAAVTRQRPGPARVSVVLEHPVLRLRLLRSGGICRRRAPFVGVSHRIVRIRNAVNGGFDYHVHIAGLPLVSKGRWRRFWQAPSAWFACPPCVPRVFRFPTGHRVFFFRFQLWSAGRRNRTDGRVLGCREKEARRRERSRPTVSGIVAVPWSLRLCRSGQVFSFRQAAVSSRFAAIRSRAVSWA